MTRTQIQLLDPLFKRLRSIAKAKDFFFAEITRLEMEKDAEIFPENHKEAVDFLEWAPSSGDHQYATSEASSYCHTLRHHGVTRFATANVKHFQNFGFTEVWNPLLS